MSLSVLWIEYLIVPPSAPPTALPLWLQLPLPHDCTSLLARSNVFQIVLFLTPLTHTPFSTLPLPPLSSLLPPLFLLPLPPPPFLLPQSRPRTVRRMRTDSVRSPTRTSQREKRSLQASQTWELPSPWRQRQNRTGTSVLSWRRP